MEPKGNLIELSTFLKYDLTEVIGHKTAEKGGKTLVNYVWCKVFVKFKTQIESPWIAKGSAKTSALVFINGKSSVTKHQLWIYSNICTCLVYKIFFLDFAFCLRTFAVYRKRCSFKILICAITFVVWMPNYRKKSKKDSFVLFYAFRCLSKATPVFIGKLSII